jgi:hypothetical protein
MWFWRSTEAEVPTAPLIDRLCREVGWAVDQRRGDAVCLHFTDERFGVRKLMARPSVSDGVQLVVCSNLALEGSGLPRRLFAFLQERNLSASAGQWRHLPPDGGRTVLYLTFEVPAPLLSAETFRLACESMVTEAQGLDQMLREDCFSRYVAGEE